MSEKGVKYPGNDIQVLSGWEHLLRRPGMYMGKKSVFGLQCLLVGIDLARGMVCGPVRNKVFDMDSDQWWEFEKWVKAKTGHRGRMRSFDIALEEAEKDDEKAFDLWAEWFIEWKKETAPKTRPANKT